MVYDTSLDNQHKATCKFARRWFGPYVMTTANDNGSYHLAELNEACIAVPVSGKRIKAFKKRQEGESGPGIKDDKDGWTGANNDLEREG